MDPRPSMLHHKSTLIAGDEKEMRRLILSPDMFSGVQRDVF